MCNNCQFTSVEAVTKDLTPGQEKPLWPLTSYSPAKHQPILVGGLDESFEELRVRAVTAVKSGAIDDYVRSALLLYTLLNKSAAMTDKI
jgi:hypothetical protein